MTLVCGAVSGFRIVCLSYLVLKHSIKTQHLGVHRGPLLSLAMSSTHGLVVDLRDDVFSIN